IKVTPTVHSMEDVSLDLDAEFKVLTGQSVNGIPVISSRVLKNKVRLKTGEWAAIAGLVDTNEARTISGLAGLSRIPALSALTSTHEHDKSKDQVLVLVRPHLVTAPPSEAITHTYRVGSEAHPITPL